MRVVSVFRGVCKGCGSELESIQLTPVEYTHLEARVMADIIQGKDVFQKTTAEVRQTHRHTDTQTHRHTQTDRASGSCEPLFVKVKAT